MSARRVVTTRRADEDIAAAVEHYADQDAIEAALNFVDALKDVVALIGEHPQLGSTRLGSEAGIPELRTTVMRKFPYLVFFTDDDDAVRVHRVLHTARDVPSVLLDD